MLSIQTPSLSIVKRGKKFAIIKVLFLHVDLTPTLFYMKHLNRNFLSVVVTRKTEIAEEDFGQLSRKLIKIIGSGAGSGVKSANYVIMCLFLDI